MSSICSALADFFWATEIASDPEGWAADREPPEVDDPGEAMMDFLGWCGQNAALAAGELAGTPPGPQLATTSLLKDLLGGPVD